MKYIIGIDEVGRGSLAGPVVVAAAILPRELRIVNRELGVLRDSKKLTAKQREKWFAYFQNHSHVHYAIARVYPRGIERMNISRAANLAALRAYQRLAASNPEAEQARNETGKRHSQKRNVFLDGGLFLGNGRGRLPGRTVIRGDEKIPAIKIASIIAKVHRDRYMTQLAKRYPAYGFEIHKGYGTKVHRAAIRRHGASEVHRLTFIRKYNTLGVGC